MYYYTSYDTDLYSFDPRSRKEEYLMSSNFDGDIKFDSINKLFVWSSPSLGHITLFNLTDGVKTTVVENSYEIMGIGLDEASKEIYYCDQEDHKIMKVSYFGGTHEEIHDLVDLGLQPYGIDIDREDNIMYFTAASDYFGYIYSSTLGGGDLTKHYTSSSKAVYGIVYDKEHAMLWWVENKGVANGIYACRESAFNDVTFVKYFEQSYWLAAIFDQSILLIGDYSAGVMYELEFAIEENNPDDDYKTVQLIHSDPIAYLAEVRGVAYYVRYDEEDEGTAEAEEAETVDAPLLDDPNAAPKNATDAPDGPVAGVVVSDGPEFAQQAPESVGSSGKSAGGFPTSTVLASGALVAAVVGAVVVARKRQNPYASIAQNDFEI